MSPSYILATNLLTRVNGHGAFVVARQYYAWSRRHIIHGYPDQSLTKVRIYSQSRRKDSTNTSSERRMLNLMLEWRGFNIPAWHLTKNENLHSKTLHMSTRCF